MMRQLAFVGLLFPAVLCAQARRHPELYVDIRPQFDPVGTAHIFAEAPVFAYDGANWKKEYAWSTNVTKVKSGAYMRLDYAWRKLEWGFGCYFLPQMRFEDAKGKCVRNLGFDATNIRPAIYPMFEADSVAGQGERIDYYSYVQVPTNAVQMRLGVACCGNPFRVRVENITFQYVNDYGGGAGPWFNQPYRARQIDYPSTGVTDEQIRAKLKARPKAVPEFRVNGDRTDLYVNGERILPATRHCQRTDESANRGNKRGVQEFKKAGYRIFNVNIVAGEHTYADPQPQIWREDGSFDIDLMERMIYKILREDLDAYVILVCKVSAPHFWKMQNKGELECDFKGRYRVFAGTAFTDKYTTQYPNTPGEHWVPSLFSEKYLKDMGAALEEIFRRFEKTLAAKAVIGVYVTGGDDCQFRLQRDPWNSPLAERAFRKWLKEEYRDDAGLAAAWRTPGVRISEVKIPTDAEINPPRQFTSESGRCRESDFRRFCSISCWRNNSAMRSAVKRGAPRFLVGGYNGALTLSGNEGRGRHAMWNTITDKGFDFTIWLPGYSIRRNDMVAPLGLFAYNGSMRLHGKWIVTELDIRNPAQANLTFGLFPLRQWQERHDYKTFSDFLDFATGCAMAWGGGWHQYPLNRIFYDTPEAMRCIKQAASIAAEAQGRPLGKDRFAMFFDDRTTDYCSRNRAVVEKPNNYCWPAVDSVWQAGVRFDNYLVEDVLSDGFAKEAPKVVVMADASTMKADAIRKVRERFARDGRVLVWLGTPGVLSGDADSAISSALGIQVKRTHEERPATTCGSDRLVNGIKGFWHGDSRRRSLALGLSYELTPSDGWVALANYAGTSICAAAVRRNSLGGTEIVIGAAGAARPDLFRNIAREAGIRPCIETDDCFVTGASLAMLGASSGGGMKRVFKPEGVKRMRPLNGRKVYAETPDYVDVYLRWRETAVFKLEY